MATVSNNNPQPGHPDTRESRRDRRAVKTKPSPAEVAAEAASIYPDTFDTFETSPTPEEIAAEAYAIYLSRGEAHGQHEEDWYEAERRLRDRPRRPR